MTSAPVISEVPIASDSAGAPLSSVPLPLSAAPGSRLAAPAEGRGVPINHINFPHSPSPVPSFNSIMQWLPLAPTLDMSVAAPYPPLQPDWEGNTVPKYHKLSFPIYEGKEDLLGWLNKCEQFFYGQQMREADKVWMASYHLTSVAQQWFLVLENDIGRLSWPDFHLYCQ